MRWGGKKQEFMSCAKSVMWDCIWESVSMTVTQNRKSNVSTGDGSSSDEQRISPNKYTTKINYFATFTTVCQ
jgi:hypothetical protein